MRTVTPIHRPALLLVLVTLVAGPAFAQGSQRDPRAVGPYRGLFGGNSLDPDSKNQVDFTASLFGGYDDNVTAQATGAGFGDPRTQASSSYGGGSASLRYARNIFDRVSFQAGANVSSSYYADLDDLLATGYGGTAALNWRIDGRTTLALAQNVRFSPFFGFALFPVPGVSEGVESFDAGTDTRVVQQDNLAYASFLSLGRDLTKRSTFTLSGHWQRTDFQGGGEGVALYRDRQSYGAAARWTYRLTQAASARLGYGYRTGDYGGIGTRRLENHNIDVGIDYARALSFSRRTSFSFGTGTAAYTTATGGDAGSRRQYRFTFIGNAALMHEIGKSWVALASYNRGVRTVDGFAEVFLTDSLAVTVGGYLGARSRLSLTGGFSWGDYGATIDGQRRTRIGYVQPAYQFALSRNLAFQASYFHYRYRFDNGNAALPSGFLPEYARQGYRLSLSYWVPLLVSGTR